MCGIAGFYNSPALKPELINAMINNIRHRGPDKQAFYKDDTVSLGHARLKVIDLSDDANQPFYSKNGRYVMVYNGEVYNFRELAAEMRYTPFTSSDTEIILECFQRYGEGFVNKLNGMFAIAVYDKENGELNIWRDRFGIKPLFYYWDGTNFAFASELKALYTLPFQKEINEQSLHDYLFLEYVPQPNTILKNFHKLGNGKQLTVDGKRLRLFTYYELTDKLKSSSELSEREAIEGFEDLFNSSLKYRQISDVKVGSFLSGGVDSSAICSGLKSTGSSIDSFNIGFDNSQYDESIFAREVASELGMKHHHYQLNSDDLLENFENISNYYDEPFAVSSVFPTFKVSQLAKSHITVALSGDGGDELFMGYGHYTWYSRLKNLDSTIGRIGRKTASSLLSCLPSRYARISGLLDYKNLKSDWPHVWSQEQYMFSGAEINRLTSRINYSNSLNNSWQELQKVTDDPLLQISLFDIKHYLTDDLLYKVDIASMANSLEVRLPFLDYRLVEYCINLPSNFKIKHNESKYLLKKYLEKYLPSNLVYRKKWGFGSPIDQWLKHELSFLMDEYLTKDRIKKSGLVDPEIVMELVKNFRNGKHFLYKRIWALIVLEIWLEKHFRKS